VSYETLYDAERFGGQAAEKVEQAGGYRAAERLTGVNYSTIHSIAHGQEPKAEQFLRLLKWVTGRTLKY